MVRRTHERNKRYRDNYRDHILTYILVQGHTQTSDLLHRASNNNGRGASPVPCACLSGDNEDTWKKCIEVQNFVEYNALRRRSYENIRDNFRNMPNEKHDESDRERQAYQQCPFNGMNPKFVQNYMPDIGEIPQALTEVFAGVGHLCSHFIFRFIHIYTSLVIIKVMIYLFVII